VRSNELWPAFLLIGIGSLIMKRLEIAVACILVSVYLFVGLGGVVGSVMCIGEDGHVGTKTEEGGSCSEPSVALFLPNSPCSQPSTEDCFSCEESPCGPCVDIPVPSNDALHKSASSKRASKHMQKGGCATLTHNPRASYESAVGGLFSACLPETNSTLYSIRTVVLLI